MAKALYGQVGDQVGQVKDQVSQGQGQELDNKSLTLKKVFLVHFKLSAKQDGALVVEVGGLDI